MSATSSRMMIGSRLLVPLLCVAVVAILNLHHVDAQDEPDEFSCNPTDIATCSVNAVCTDELFNLHFCICDPGFQNENISCVDIDECADGTDNCSDIEECNNTEGGYNCSCITGYTLYGNYCTEAGNCTAAGVTCHDYATCENDTCTCDDGFEGDGVLMCRDFDDCPTAICAENATCFNFPGSYFCLCDPGFTGNGSDYCQSMCPINICGDNATCYLSLNGTELCECDVGFSGDGFSDCDDINECLDYDECDPYATCTNTEGGFVCNCSSGYYGNGTICTDIDECEDPYVCTWKEDCINYHGTYACVCQHGYVRTDSGCRKSLLPILIAVDAVLGFIILCIIVCVCCCCNACCRRMCCCTMECHSRSKEPRQPKWSKRYNQRSNPQTQAMPQPQYMPRAQYAPQAQYTAQGPAQPVVQWNNKPCLRMNPSPGQGMTGDCRFRMVLD